MSTATHGIAEVSYVSRPQLPADLANAWRRAPSQPLGPLAAAEEVPVDMARLLEMVDDDAAALRELVNLYLSESAELMGSLRSAVQAGSAEQVEWAAHKLGGSSATCGMIGIVAPLRELERSGRAGHSSQNEPLLLEAGRQHRRICAYLEAHVLHH